MQKEIFKAKPKDLSNSYETKENAQLPYMKNAIAPSCFSINMASEQIASCSWESKENKKKTQNLIFTYCKTRTANSIKRLWRYTP